MKERISLSDLIFRDWNWFSVGVGYVIAQFGWAVQPEFSQGRQLIENGFFNEPFFIMGILGSFYILGIFVHRLYKEIKKGKEKING